jgi:NitT/TauT family transport system permease protein
MATKTQHLPTRTRHWLKSRIPTAIAGVVVLALWQGLAMYLDNNRIFAYPEFTYDSLVARSDTVFVRIVESFTSIIVAFIMAVIVGVLLGLIIAEIYALRQMAMPLVIFGYSVPHPVLAPIFIIWFIVAIDEIVLLSFTGPSAYLHPGVTAEMAQQSFAINGVTTFGAWVAFFPVFLGTITGMNALEERYEHLGTVLGASRWQMVRYFRFWRALPNIVSSVKSTVQLSIVGVIVAEFIASSQGIGYQIVLAWKRAELGYMFGVLLVIMIGSYIFFQTAVWLMKVLTPPGTVE